MKIDINQLIELYDTRHKKWSDQTGSPISSITGLIGEDLVLGILEHYFNNELGKKASINRSTPLTGNKKGPWLDAWMMTEKEYYQVEIKNWCASAIGGKAVDDKIDILRNEILIEGTKIKKQKPRETWSLLEASIHNYYRYLLRSDADHAKKVWKVLTKMENKLLADIDSNTPPKALLAFWSPVVLPTEEISLESSMLPALFPAPIDQFRDPIKAAGFEINNNGRVGDFNEITIFSCSLYLRQLRNRNIETIEVDMTRFGDRLKRLQKLFPDVFPRLSLD